MKLYQGRLYKDDRLFILDFTPVKKGNQIVWAVITRRNCEGFPPFRFDEFQSKEAAIEFIKKIEPTTPLISLESRSPDTPLSYDKYCEQLRNEGIPSAMEIYELNKRSKREIIVESLFEQ